MADWHGTKRMWVIHSWPWYWLVWPWWGGRMYRILTGVTSDVGVPSTYVVWYCWWSPLVNRAQSRFPHEEADGGPIFRGSVPYLIKHLIRNSRNRYMVTSSNGKVFRVTGLSGGEFACHRWIPIAKASDTELSFFSLICAPTKGWINNRGAGDLRRHWAHYDVTNDIFMFDIWQRAGQQCWLTTSLKYQNDWTSLL